MVRLALLAILAGCEGCNDECDNDFDCDGVCVHDRDRDVKVCKPFCYDASPTTGEAGTPCKTQGDCADGLECLGCVCEGPKTGIQGDWEVCTSCLSSTGYCDLYPITWRIADDEASFTTGDTFTGKLELLSSTASTRTYKVVATETGDHPYVECGLATFTEPSGGLFTSMVLESCWVSADIAEADAICDTSWVTCDELAPNPGTAHGPCRYGASRERPVAPDPLVCTTAEEPDACD